MGLHNAKFKRIFEEIDTSCDGQVSFLELSEFMALPKACSVLQDLTDEELENVQSFINDGNHEDPDAKMSFEDFLQLMRDNETMSNLNLRKFLNWLEIE